MKMHDALKHAAPHTAGMLDAVFGNREFKLSHMSVGVVEMDSTALVLDYLKLLTGTKEPLPILAVGGTYRSAGRTTFLNWLLSIMKPTTASLVSELNAMVLMRGFRLVTLDSVHIDPAFLADLKYLASAIGGPCIALSTNMGDADLRNALPQRLWYAEPRPIAIPDLDKLARLEEEIPAFRALLRSYSVQCPRTTRTWFSTTLHP